MKKTLQLILFCSIGLFALNSSAQVNIGTGTVTGQALPIEPFYGYSYSQSIYLSSEINASGSITGVTFFTAPGTVLTNSNDWVVYLGHTTKTSFSSNTDWETTGLVQKFAGIVSNVGDQVTITFLTPFVYNGTDNLIVAVDENAASYNGSADDFLCSSVGTDRALAYRTDVVANNPDPTGTLPTATFVQQAIPNIQFIGISQACPTPSALTSANITSTSAEIGWTENGTSTTWNIEYGPAGFTPTGTPSISGTLNNPETLSSLTPATDYDVYIQADCGGSGTSNWVGPLSFTTACSVYTPTYLQDFASYVPDCWEEAKGILTASTTLTGTTSSWVADGFANSGFSGAARMNIYTTNQNEWLISPSIDLTGGPFQLKYDVALTTYSGTGATTMDADDSLAVVISTDNGATWSAANILQLYTSGSEPSNTGDLTIIDLTAYTGIVKIGFYAYSSQSLSVDNNVYIDNFVVEPIPACAQVSGITATNVTATALDLGWTANGIGMMWNIEYGITGFTPTGTPTIAGTTNNPESITGLTSNTTYDFYVQSDCAASGTSVWTGPFTVTTPCGIYTPDYAEDFTSYVPGCWEEAKGFISPSTVLTGTSSSWTSDGFASVGTSGAARMNIYTTNQNEWLISPSIDLTGGPFQLEYDVALTVFAGTAATTMDADDSLAVVISTDNGATWSNTNILTTYTAGSEPSNTGERAYIDLSAYSGVVRFGFYATSTQNLTVDNDISIDNFLVTDLCPPTYGTDTQVACETFDWIDGNTYTSSNNTATVTLTNAAGCDSIVTLDLTINNSATGTDVQTECAGSFTWIDGNIYTASNNTATFTIVGGAANGCDSIVTLDLTVGTPSTGTDVQTACDTYTWIDGNTYTASNNTATFVVPNASGCDSTVTLDLTINSSSTGTDVQTACETFTWIDGNTYTASNNTATYTVVGGAANGCDSIVTLDLTINTGGTSTDVQTACETFTWIDGNTYTSSNNTATYTVVGGSANGCDSIVTLDLTINNATAGTDVQTACETYMWIDGNTYTASNNTATYTIVGGAATGCDSIVTLDLTINNAATGTDVQSECLSYTWIDGNTYTASNNTATYTIVGGATSGCDSIVTLDLTITPVDVTVTNSDPSLTANAVGATFNWLDCDNNYSVILGETSATFTATSNGNYAVRVNQNGCTDTSSCLPIVTVSLDDLALFEGVNVYPNPVKNTVNVEMGSLETATISLLDLNGKLLFSEEHVGNTIYSFEMNQESGMYFIEVRSEDSVKQFKVIKE